MSKATVAVMVAATAGIDAPLGATVAVATAAVKGVVVAAEAPLISVCTSVCDTRSDLDIRPTRVQGR